MSSDGIDQGAGSSGDGIDQPMPDRQAMWKEACDKAREKKQLERRMNPLHTSHDARESEGADSSMDATVRRLKELSTD
eukprot:12098946-Karenia_brevis.AAC.1